MKYNGSSGPAERLYFYDLQGRLLLDSASDNSGNTVYIYTPDSITIFSYRSSGSLNTKTVLYLNSEKLSDSAIVHYSNFDNYVKYNYDAASFCIRQIVSDASSIVGFVITDSISNGDVVYTKEDYITKVNNIAYTYDTTHLNTIGYYNTGQSYNGASSKHLIATKISNGVPFAYRYAFDSQNRVSTMIISVDSYAKTDIYTFTYY